jgi:hypothetical protein
MAIRDIVQAAAGVGGGGEYVEDVFSTYLYTGDGTARSINNGIDLSGEGGMVWLKNRGFASAHSLHDTERTPASQLNSNTTLAATTLYGDLSSFNSNGFSLGTAGGGNNTTGNVASWTFRKAPKFFDVVTFTGNGVAGREITHSLGSVPGCIIVKSTSIDGSWNTYHRSLGATQYIQLNTTAGAGAAGTVLWYATEPTDSVFTLGTNSNVNASGVTYVAYVLAHDAGGFGDDGEQDVISCGSFTTDGSSNATVNLGYEPQWILAKKYTATGGVGNWYLIDTMRGFVNPGASTGSDDARLYANDSSAENAAAQIGWPTATGFFFNDGVASESYIYIAIRRPMKTPEAGTEVYNAITRTGNGAPATVTGVGFTPDMVIPQRRSSAAGAWISDRLRGVGPGLILPSTGAESNFSENITFTHDGMTLASSGSGYTNSNSITYINWFFKRAPGFMDVVCYTGAGALQAKTHNLGVVPELIIVKCRSNGFPWFVYSAPTGNASYVSLESTGAAVSGSGFWQSTTPTTTQFFLSGQSGVGGAFDYVAYLFATLAGVSKVGSYTGTGADLNVDCGFSAGARFILIKRTDSTGDWYVWDSARGIAAGNDPYLLLNSTAAEVTNTDYIDPLSSGFTVTATAPAALNASGGTYIFLAIA